LRRTFLRRGLRYDISGMVSDNGDPAYRVDADLYCDDILCVLHMGARTEEPGDGSDSVSLRGDGITFSDELAV